LGLIIYLAKPNLLRRLAMAADQARREFPPNEPSEASNRRARDERSGQNKGEESLVRQARIGWQKGSFTGEDMQCRYQGGPAECTEGERIASVASSRGSISCSCVECRGQSRRWREKQTGIVLRLCLFGCPVQKPTASVVTCIRFSSSERDGHTPIPTTQRRTQSRTLIFLL
jgi:hypothetical protein